MQDMQRQKTELLWFFLVSEEKEGALKSQKIALRMLCGITIYKITLHI